MKELKRVSRYIYNCKRCGMCGNKVTAKVPYVCPIRKATPGFEQFYARGKIIIAQGLLEGRLSWSPEVARALYSCTLCGNCMTQCAATDADRNEPMVATTKIVEAMRADLLSDYPDGVPRAYHQVLTATRQYENPWGLPRSARKQWYTGLEVVAAGTEPAEVLLFAGCTIASSPVLAERARRAVQVLNSAGIRPAVLGSKEVCCGSVQRKIGAVSLAQELMEKNISLINHSGCKKVVTLCAGCYSTLSTEYRTAREPLAAEVVHMVELLAVLVRDKKLTFKKNRQLTVAYHDPCHLGRHAGIFNQPRAVLAALPGITLVERRATREHTICCGAGGGMRLFDDGTLAAQIGAAAVAEAAAVGAQALVSACPFCEMNLAAGSSELKEELPVYDIVDLVFESLAREPG